MKILLTGGAGYIGSHIAVELSATGHEIIIADNLSNSKPPTIKSIEKIIGKKVHFYEIDIRDKEKLTEIFTEHHVDNVIHLAGLKSVGESVTKPLAYYENNLDSTLALLDVMNKFKVKNLIFSSSATVYGDPEFLPLTEDARVGFGIPNPYGRTKYMIEEILKDLAIADPTWNITILRYFNPVGAHESGLIGEDPSGIPNNLMPYIAKVAIGQLPQVQVFGNDYNTPDGTGVRDYIHVADLAAGHVVALNDQSTGIKIYNLSTGKGTSVLEAIAAYEQATDKQIPYEITARRPGDVAAVYADASKAERELNWKVQKGINAAAKDDWNYRQKSQS